MSAIVGGISSFINTTNPAATEGGVAVLATVCCVMIAAKLGRMAFGAIKRFIK